MEIFVDGEARKENLIVVHFILDVLSFGKRPINILIVTRLTALVIKSNLRPSNCADFFSRSLLSLFFLPTFFTRWLLSRACLNVCLTFFH